jgi:hypothetical protein
MTPQGTFDPGTSAARSSGWKSGAHVSLKLLQCRNDTPNSRPCEEGGANPSGSSEGEVFVVMAVLLPTYATIAPTS